MKKHNTSDRLKQIMSERNLKQIDILNLAAPYCKKYDIKLNKNDLSQYVSGKVEPGQNKLYILGLALNVSEAWLIGFDVPKMRITPENGGGYAGCNYYNQFIKEEDTIIENSDCLNELVRNFSLLNETGKIKLIDYANDLINSGNYSNEE